MIGDGTPDHATVDVNADSGDADRLIAAPMIEDTTLRLFLIRKFLPGLMLALLASQANAATLDGATLPDSYTVDGEPLPLNGIGVRTITIFHIGIYVAGLYLARTSHDATEILTSSEPKVILLQFIHGGSKADVEKHYREGEVNNCGMGGCSPSDQADFEQLVAAAPAVSAGDRSTYVFTDKRVRVFANDRLIGDFTNPDLAHQLLAGFIGDHPPSPELRSHLLGLPDD
jgi:hypothetical protein